MRFDLIIANGQVVTMDSIFPAAVLVKDGKIAGYLSSAELPEAEEVLDASGCYVLPGVIDVHVHFRDPGLTYKEDFGTGSAAAACGGVTTVLDMPNVKPLVTNTEALETKLSEVSKKAWVDFGLYGSMRAENIDQLEDLAEAGVIGFKLLMGESASRLPPPPDGVIFEALQAAARTKLTVAVHAENNGILQHYAEKLRMAGRTDPLAHVESRPNIAEAEAISRAIMYAESTGAKVHIAHMSSKEGVDLVGAAKRRGLDITAETCPHYLVLDCTHMQKVGPLLKMNPPVRTRADAERLWEGVLDGTVEAIATDHSPHSLEEKLKDNIWEAVAGFCGVETSVPLMLTEVNKGRISLNQYVRVACEGPARIFGLYPQKGSLLIGADADFTVVDLGKEWTIKAEDLHSKSKVTPFDGFQVKGKPVATIVRGKIVMKDGQLLGQPQGRFVRPTR